MTPITAAPHAYTALHPAQIATYRSMIYNELRISRVAIFFFFGRWERHLFVLVTWIENNYQVFDFISAIRPNGVKRHNLILRKKK